MISSSERGLRFVEARDGERKAEGFSDDLITVLDPAGVAAEAYRALRTNLFYALVDEPPKVILLTSPGPGEGKTTTCANLGVVMAQAGKSTLVVDCDLRKPKIHRTFRLRNFRGVVDVLVGQSSMLEVCQEPFPGLKVLTAGPVPPNPAELLGSRRFADFLNRVREDFDYVLVDAPPVGAVSDPIILATQVDGVLLVVDAHKTRKGALRQGVRSLEAVDATVLGTVMNGVTPSRRGQDSYQAYTYG
jgi:receptor protein-tyrosine kinase